MRCQKDERPRTLIRRFQSNTVRCTLSSLNGRLFLMISILDSCELARILPGTPLQSAFIRSRRDQRRPSLTGQVSPGRALSAQDGLQSVGRVCRQSAVLISSRPRSGGVWIQVYLIGSFDCAVCRCLRRRRGGCVSAPGVAVNRDSLRGDLHTATAGRCDVFISV